MILREVPIWVLAKAFVAVVWVVYEQVRSDREEFYQNSEVEFLVSIYEFLLDHSETETLILELILKVLKTNINRYSHELYFEDSHERSDVNQE